MPLKIQLMSAKNCLKYWEVSIFPPWRRWLPSSIWISAQRSPRPGLRDCRSNIKVCLIIRFWVKNLHGGHQVGNTRYSKNMFSFKYNNKFQGLCQFPNRFSFKHNYITNKFSTCSVGLNLTRFAYLSCTVKYVCERVWGGGKVDKKIFILNPNKSMPPFGLFWEGTDSFLPLARQVVAPE